MMDRGTASVCEAEANGVVGVASPGYKPALCQLESEHGRVLFVQTLFCDEENEIDKTLRPPWILRIEPE